MVRHRKEHGRPHVVVVGAGFGGLACANALADAPARLTVIDRRNYHLFQPLLYQVATAALAPTSIATPIRSIVGRQRNTTVLMDEVRGVDRAGRRVFLSEQAITYDFLVVATGARHAYFGRDDWEPFAPGIKKIEDAMAIRHRILLAFERAEMIDDPKEQRRLLTFVVVGGGPTGVELAGAISELAKTALAKDFHWIDPASARIVLVEAGPRVLPSFPEALSARAASALERLGVELKLGAAVTACDGTGVSVGDERIDAGNVLWAAGVRASPAARWLGAPADKVGRVIVDGSLALADDPHVFVIGDTASVPRGDGRPLPGVAPVAKQQGLHVARTIKAILGGATVPAPFRYRDFGSMATIGRRAAVADFGPVRMSGFVAWILWGVVHVYFLIGFRSRVAVAAEWLWAYLTYKRGARLILGLAGAERADSRPSAAAAN
ncbi:MAG: NAD(P)/FAD-dependent oxidoreductase [Alphaproteobacteria bacterium]|nr:NAD(P)/FAD-dependent oxidoreductase [Alphaproteobacteria bacterium]